MFELPRPRLVALGFVSTFLLAASCGGTVVFEEDGGQGDGGGNGSVTGTVSATTGQGASSPGSGAGGPASTSVTIGTGTPARPTAEQLCGLYCDCLGCGDRDLQDCIGDTNQTLQEAARQGCDDEVDAYLACFFDQAQCIDGQLQLDACDDSLEVFNRCIGR